MRAHLIAGGMLAVFVLAGCGSAVHLATNKLPADATHTSQPIGPSCDEELNAWATGGGLSNMAAIHRDLKNLRHAMVRASTPIHAISTLGHAVDTASKLPLPHCSSLSDPWYRALTSLYKGLIALDDGHDSLATTRLNQGSLKLTNIVNQVKIDMAG